MDVDASPSPLSPALVRRLERIDADAFADLYRCAEPDDPLGFRLHQIGSVTVMAAPGTDVLALNRVLGLGLDEPATEAVLDAVCAVFEEAGSPRFFVQVSPAAEPPALYDWLAIRGLRHRNDWVKLYRATADPLPVQTDLRIEEVGPEYGEPFGRMVAPAFDWPEAMEGLLARSVGRPGWRHFFAFDGDEPVAVAGLFVSAHGGYLGPAVTSEEHRGRGAQSALIARRLREAAALSVDLVTVETAAETEEHPVVQSYRNLLRLGFQEAYRRPNYLWAR